MNAYTFDWDVVFRALPSMIQGLGLTLQITIITIVLSMILAVPVAVGRMSKIEVIRWTAQGYIELFRCTPLLVQLFWIFYALPALTGVTLPGYVSALIALTANLTAFMAETYRSGFQSVPVEQVEAGRMLQLTRFQQLRYIIVPQAMRQQLPVILSLNISLFKDTALVSTIAVSDLMFISNTISAQNYRALEIFTLAALIYFAIAFPVSLITNAIERRMQNNSTPGAKTGTSLLAPHDAGITDGGDGMSHSALSPQLPTDSQQKDNEVTDQKGAQVTAPAHATGLAGRRQVLVEARGLQKSFGNRKILRNVDFQMHSGDITVIIGKSGSGKSTLLRALAGLTDPDDGQIDFDGRTVFAEQRRTKEWDGLRSEVGMVFQTYTLWPHMNVLENLVLAPRKVRGASASESRDRAESALAEVGMKHHILSKPTQLSGGERQRVAIARALMMKPKLLLCDEITSALDPPVAAEVLDVLRRLKEEDGIAVALVTHDMAFASKAADRVVFFHNGEIAVNATPEAAFDNCDNPDLKKFVDAVRF